MSKKDKFTKNLEYLIKDFKSDENPQILAKTKSSGVKVYKWYEIKLPKKLKIKHPFIVFVILVHIKKLPFHGKWEKVAWEIPILYKGVPFIFAHRKFGFEINSVSKGQDVKRIAIEALEKINKAVPYAEKIIEPVIRDKVHNGDITLENHYEAISSKYNFFKTRASKEFERLAEYKAEIQMFVDRAGEGNYYATAMLDAYFSRLEHTLVLILPFIQRIDLRRIDIEDFIGSNWKEKYKKVLDISKSKQASQYYEKLIQVKEEYRNPLSHGYFYKNGNSFMVHMEDIGAIPMSLTKYDGRVRYGFRLFNPLAFGDITKLFNGLDRFFKTSKETKYGIKYLETSLNVSYDNESVHLYRSSMNSETEFNKMIYYLLHTRDRAVNMDW
jgi:hypothetical protein